MAGTRNQISALVRKNAVYQRRNWLANSCLVLAPVFICVLMVVIQELVNNSLDKPQYKCGCKCVECCKDVITRTVDSEGVEEFQSEEVCDIAPEECRPGQYDRCLRHTDECGPEFSDNEQAVFCGIQHPTINPTFQLIPAPGERATLTEDGCEDVYCCSLYELFCDLAVK